jgi:hypothetical protein
MCRCSIRDVLLSVFCMLPNIRVYPGGSPTAEKKWIYKIQLLSSMEGAAGPDALVAVTDEDVRQLL